MAIFTRCTSHSCELKHRCYRYHIDQPANGQQAPSAALLPSHAALGCTYFIPRTAEAHTVVPGRIAAPPRERDSRFPPGP